MNRIKKFLNDYHPFNLMNGTKHNLWGHWIICPLIIVVMPPALIAIKDPTFNLHDLPLFLPLLFFCAWFMYLGGWARDLDERRKQFEERRNRK